MMGRWDESLILQMQVIILEQKLDLHGRVKLILYSEIPNVTLVAFGPPSRHRRGFIDPKYRLAHWVLAVRAIQ